ncbi:MAG: hypothetical protein RLZZ347_158 [Candidatus Parcubacteria bacterium]|jgi:hypothetical protein
MNDVALRSDESLLSGDKNIEASFDKLSPLGQVKVLRGVIEFIASSLPSFVKIPLGEPHELYDKGLRQFDSVTKLGPDITWADHVRCLIPLKCSNQIGDCDRSLHRWIERGVCLRSDGCLLEVNRTSEIHGALICNTTPLEVAVSVMTDNRLTEFVACRGVMKTLFRQVIGAYRAYAIDEYGRVERARKLQEFCGQFRFLVSKALLEEQ